MNNSERIKFAEQRREELLLLIKCWSKNSKMPRKPEGSELWSEVLQVSVTPEIKNEISEIAAKSGESQSSTIRKLLVKALAFELEL